MPPPDWVCPYCKSKKCKAYDRTEQSLAGQTLFGARRQAKKDQIRELQACKKRMKEKG